MQKAKELTLYLYRHHFTRYLVVGGTTFIIDFGLLVLFHGKFGFNIAVATSISYWTSIIYNFILNRYWTFDAREKESLKRHLSIYFFLLLANYLFAVIFVSYMSHHISYIIAKAIAVLIQMIWTYPVYQKVIFVKSAQS
jgi:putative flippase GtrA